MEIFMHSGFFRAYLSGPISGLSYEDAISWTDYAQSKLKEFGINGYKPLRGKEFLKNKGILEPTAVSYLNPLATPKGIIGRDRYDVMSADILLVNLLGAKEKSIGTMYEMAWADMAHKPIVLVIEDTNNVHEHVFVTESMTHRTNNLDEGIEIVKSILLP